MHRDVKPANVMITPDGHAILTDFGLALLLQERSTTTSVIGTLEYMSPEQISTPKQVGPPTDQYAFGVMLYEMFTGILPYSADNPAALIHQVITEPIEVPSTINTALTPAVDKVLLQALARDPKSRFPSLTAFIEALSEAITLGLNTSGMSFTASIASINFPASERPTSRVSSASRTSRVAGSHSRKTQVAQTRIAKNVQAQRRLEKWVWGGIVTSLLVMLVTGVYLYPRLVASALPPLVLPTQVTLSSDHSKVTVLDSNNQPLYEAPVKGEVIALDRVDLDGDKKADELITGVAGTGVDAQKIIAWKSDGSRAWEHSFANTVAPYPAYKDKPLKVFNVWSYKSESGATGVVAVARVPVGSPSQIVLIDPGGAVLREYWTPSHITAVTIADLNNDKVNDILVAAENDDLRDQLGVKSNTSLFTLFMLDPRTMKGEAPPYRGGHGAGEQLWYGAVCPAGVKVESLTTKDVDGDGSLDLWARLSDKRDLFINAKGKVVQAAQDTAFNNKPTFRLYGSNGLDGKCESETPVPVAQVSPTATNASVPNATQPPPNVNAPTNTQLPQLTAATTSIAEIKSETPTATVNPKSTPTVKPNNPPSSPSIATTGEAAVRITATSVAGVATSTNPFSLSFGFPTLPPIQTSSLIATAATTTSGVVAATTVSGGVLPTVSSGASATFTPRIVATLSTGITATTAPTAPTQTQAVAPTATTIPSTSTPTFTRTATPVTPTSTPTFASTPTPITPTNTNTAISSSLTWTTRASMPNPRKFLGAVGASNGKIYMMGGWGGDVGYSAQLLEYDPTANTWTTRASMSTARMALAVVTTSDGKIYAIGGADGSSGALATMEMYDPNTNTWTARASMSQGRYYFGAAVVNNKIYAIGGHGNPSPLTTVEEYDPATNTWVTRASMLTTQEGFGVAVANGKIYVMGGPNSLNVVEEYDPSTNTWRMRANMPTGRLYLGAVAANNGKIYAIGGQVFTPSTGFLNLVEEYNPITDTWTTSTSMPTARDQLAVALGTNGKIYAIGGSYRNEALSTVEEATLP